MIAHLQGTILEKSLGFLILDVRGVGYRVAISSHTHDLLAKEQIGAPISLFTHLAVRENAMDLYGFLNQEELSFFEMLIAISGIGPKGALAILSLATPETLRQSIAQGDSTYLTKVSGIGKKTAEKVMLELKDKIGKLDPSGSDLREETDAVEALKSLGYSVAEARDVLKKVGVEVEGTGERVKAALKFLGNEK